MPTELTRHHEEGFVFEEVPVSDILAGRYSELDSDCVSLLKNSIDRMPWRLYTHRPYSVRQSHSKSCHFFSYSSDFYLALVQGKSLRSRRRSPPYGTSSISRCMPGYRRCCCLGYHLFRQVQVYTRHNRWSRTVRDYPKTESNPGPVSFGSCDGES